MMIRYLRVSALEISLLIAIGLTLQTGSVMAQSGEAPSCDEDCQAQQCNADARSIFGRCAQMLRDDVDSALCERLEQLFRDRCVDGASETGTCLDRCDGRSTEDCERECLVDIYATWNKRAVLRETTLASFDARDRTADIRQNPELSRAVKAVILEQTRNDFEDYTFTYEVDLPLIQPPCGNVDVQPITLTEVTAQGLDGWETTTCSGGNVCSFPNQYDVAGWGPVLRYRLETMTAVTADQYLRGQNSKSAKVFLNDVELALGSEVFASTLPCESGRECVSLHFPEDVWYPASPPWPTWRVRLEFHDEDPRGEEHVCRHLIQPPAKLKNYWLHTLGETVSSSRCTSCHALDTPQLILLHHQGFLSPSDVELIPSALHPATQSVNGGTACGGCHFQFPAGQFEETRWASPTPQQNINWGQLIIANFVNWPYAICNKMVSNLDTYDLRRQHFHEDSRLFWAVGSGVLPAGGGVLPTSPPHDYGKFIVRFDRWNDHGAPCPPNLF